MTDTHDIDIDAIDDVIHGRLRLGVMAYLSAVSPASFPELRDKTGATNGNLSTHLTKLETAGYVRQEKGFKCKRPQTLVHLTDDGREAWIAYLEAMKPCWAPTDLKTASSRMWGGLCFTWRDRLGRAAS